MKNKQKKHTADLTQSSQPIQSPAAHEKMHPALAAAIARGEIAKRRMAASDGGAFSCAEFSRLLGITQAAVMHRWRKHRLVGWPAGKVVYFPVWQFCGGRMLAGIEQVLQIFCSHDCWRIMLYFLATRRSLDRQRALDLLLRGETETVITHAKNHMIANEW